MILTFNCGSSSAKYQVYNWHEKSILAKGIVERVGQPGSFINHLTLGKEPFEKEHSCPSHVEAIELIIQTILDSRCGAIENIKEIKAVGHRVVHGGEIFNKSVIIDDKALSTFKDIQDLAPLHNPANIIGIEAARKVLPEIVHCAIMDTAWHQTMPTSSYLYALPYEWYQNHSIRRYGFHGTSFLYVAKRASVLLKKEPTDANIIICHIGNGASICAVKDGVSYDTSMGLTPLEGLVMGTRSGDIDPAIPFFLISNVGMDYKEVEKALNKKSGILGITGKYIDRRDVENEAAQGNERCRLAMEMEAYRLKKYIGAYKAVLGRVDALVFTAGVGEMSPLIREKVLKGLEHIGIGADYTKNSISRTRNAETDITSSGSDTKIFIIPTDEELVMTEDTYALMQGNYDIHTNFTYSFQNADYINKARAEGLKQDLIKNPELNTIIAH